MLMMVERSTLQPLDQMDVYILGAKIRCPLVLTEATDPIAS